MRHGEQTGVDLQGWLSDDPELGLVYADMNAWADAHPCAMPPDAEDETSCPHYPGKCPCMGYEVEGTNWR